MRELYWITVVYDMPVSGTIQIYAENEEQAKDIIAQAHKGMKEFSIIDCYKLTAEQSKNWGNPEENVEEDKRKLN